MAAASEFEAAGTPVDAAPKMSVVILVPDRYETVGRTMHALRLQTARRDLEIVYVVKSPNSLADGAHELDKMNHRVVEVGDFKSTAAARAAGIRGASASLVVLAEDHSFPEPRWAELLIAAHQGPWAVVGPAMANANPRYALSWANLAIEYSPWLDPATSGPVDHAPGHNSCYKRDLLLEYGDDLGPMLEAETILHWDLRSKGHQLYLNANTRTFHLNYTLLGPALLLRFLGGRQFASARSRAWPMSKKLFYGLASPLIPLRRGWRIVRALRRIGRFMPQMLVLLPVLLASDAVGEMCGYLFGIGRAIPRLSEMEFKRHRFMKPNEIALTTSPRQEISVK